VNTFVVQGIGKKVGGAYIVARIQTGRVKAQKREETPKFVRRDKSKVFLLNERS